MNLNKAKRLDLVKNNIIVDENNNAVAVAIDNKLSIHSNLRLVPAMQPSIEKGVIYFDAISNKFRISEDGLNWVDLSYSQLPIHDNTKHLTAAPIGLDDSNSEGTSLAVARADHSHKRDVKVAKNGSNVGIRNRINLIEGNNVTITASDNAVTDSIDITISASGGSGGASSLNDLNDVDIVSPTNNQVLKYDASTNQWRNREIGSESINMLSNKTINFENGVELIKAKDSNGTLRRVLTRYANGIALETERSGDVISIYTGNSTNVLQERMRFFSGADQGLSKIVSYEPFVFNYPVKSVNANYTMSDEDCIIDADASASSITITLPTNVKIGRRYVIRKKDPSTNTVTVNANTGQNIEGSTSIVLVAQYMKLSVIAISNNEYMKEGSV